MLKVNLNISCSLYVGFRFKCDDVVKSFKENFAPNYVSVLKINNNCQLYKSIADRINCNWKFLNKKAPDQIELEQIIFYIKGIKLKEDPDLNSCNYYAGHYLFSEITNLQDRLVEIKEYLIHLGM